jgi:hypothetical protein
MLMSVPLVCLGWLKLPPSYPHSVPQRPMRQGAPPPPNRPEDSSIEAYLLACMGRQVNLTQLEIRIRSPRWCAGATAPPSRQCRGALLLLDRSDKGLGPSRQSWVIRIGDAELGPALGARHLDLHPPALRGPPRRTDYQAIRVVSLLWASGRGMKERHRSRRENACGYLGLAVAVDEARGARDAEVERVAEEVAVVGPLVVEEH